MSSGNSPKTPTRLTIPSFDPNPSVRFACVLLQQTQLQGALIGRIAIWAWLNNPSKQTFTKDVDIAVSRTAQPTLRAYLQSQNMTLRELRIGGCNASDTTRSLNIDFIDRAGEWGDLSPLFQEAIEAAVQADEKVETEVGTLPLAPIVYLIAMKIATGERKDEDDAKTLLAETTFDVDKVRSLVSQHLGVSGIGRLEVLLRETGHPAARARGDYKASP